MPLLLAEAYYRAHPGWKGRVHVQNSERLLATPFWNRIVRGLSLFLENRILFSGRKSILELVQEHSGAVFICHQLTNEYNYMILELLYLGIPVLHISECWSESGYFYSVDQWFNAVQTLNEAIEEERMILHSDLLWTVNPENPVIQERWAKLLA